MDQTLTIFSFAFTLAALAAAICFDARPGVNWPLWTIPAAAGLYYFTRAARPAALREIAAPLALVALLSLGAAVTADIRLHALIAMACIVLLSLAMRIAAGAPAERVGAGFIAASPLIGALETVGESWRRTTAVARDGSAQRSLPVVRGLLIATPVVIVLWVLLAEADPHLYQWGRAIAEAIEQLAFVPRLLFGIGIAVLTLGAYGLVLRGGARVAPALDRAPVTIAATERLIVLGAVVLLFALFVALQLPYLFGDPAGAAGTGITYADWAHRGFGELTTAAVLVTVLIVILETCAVRGGDAQERLARVGALTLVALTALVVLSAFRRITLYEGAYGFTGARLWAQAFMLGVGIALALLALEIRGMLDARRLARRTLLAAAAMLVGLVYWNTDAFIVRRNVAQFGGTEKLDVQYLAFRLSKDAMPALLAARSTLPPAQGAHLAACIARRIERTHARELREGRWFEYSVRRQAAVEAVSGAGDSVGDSRACEFNRD